MTTAARRLDGAAVAKTIEARVTERARRFLEATGRRPGLLVVLVGEDPASQVYVRRKEEAAAAAGLAGGIIRLPATASQDEVLATVDRLGVDDSVDGILVQLPLPKGLDSQAVLARVNPEKDVDGFHPINVGRLHSGLPAFAPCTPAGIMEALRHHEVPLAGAHAVVIGRSNIVGKPMAALLLQADATVTICHSKTRDLAAIARQADILVAAIGRPGFVTRDHVKPGATVVDVGMNRLENPRDELLAARLLGEGTKRFQTFRERGALVGDVDFLDVEPVAGLLTPVPGGVGPLTIAMLLSNTVEAAERRAGLAVR
jgi:methylenetetrahydrofolate dehydrogenase (NADP+)/methenyltetrahydrofolate cyclohydrolase